MKRLSDEEIQKVLYNTDSRSVAKRITAQDKERFEAIAEAQMKADAQWMLNWFLINTDQPIESLPVDVISGNSFKRLRKELEEIIDEKETD